MATECLPPIPPNIGAIAGSPLVGIMLNWFLLGVLIVQIYIYHLSFPKDRLAIKCLAYGIGVVDTIQTFLVAADGIHWYATGFGNLETLRDPFISPFDAPLLDALIALLVQSFFCWRIYVLQRSGWLAGMVFVVAMTQAGAGITVAIRGHLLGDLAKIYALVIEQSIWLAGSALADTLIAVIMTCILLRGSEHRIAATNGVVTRVIRMTVETNALTAGVAIIALALFLGFPNNPSIIVSPIYVIGKLYSNTLLAVFNNRLLVQGTGVHHFDESERSLQQRSFGGPPNLTPLTNTNMKDSYRIEVFREVTVARDNELGGKANYFENSRMSRVSAKDEEAGDEASGVAV